MKYIYLIVLMPLLASGICKRENKQHDDPNVVHCLYHQEDIYRCYSKKVACYGSAEKHKKCFYCKCPISEHSHASTSSARTGKKKK